MPEANQKFRSLPETKPKVRPLTQARLGYMPVKKFKSLEVSVDRTNQEPQAKKPTESLQMTELIKPPIAVPLQSDKPALVIRQELRPTPPKDTSVFKPVATSTPAKPTGRKVDHILLLFFPFISNYYTL